MDEETKARILTKFRAGREAFIKNQMENNYDVYAPHAVLSIFDVLTAIVEEDGYGEVVISKEKPKPRAKRGWFG